MKKVLLFALELCLFAGQVAASEQDSNLPIRYQGTLSQHDPSLSSVVSQWPTDVLKSYLWRANEYQWRTDDAAAYYGKTSEQGPGEIVMLGKKLGKYNLIAAHITFSENLSRKPKKEQDQIWQSYKAKLIQDGYKRSDMLRFSTSPVKFAGFDSNSLYLDEQSDVYEMIFWKKLSSETMRYGLGRGSSEEILTTYNYVIISRRPEIKDGYLTYPIISAFSNFKTFRHRVR